MTKLSHKLRNRDLRKKRIRSKISGTAVRPRLTVSISNLHVSAQLINDEEHKTIASVTTVGSKQTGTMTDKAAWVGSEIAKKASAAKLKAVVFDRNGKLYHGRIKALADAARKEGLEF